MTDKEQIDRITALTGEDIKKVIGTDAYYRHVDRIEGIIYSRIQDAFFWARFNMTNERIQNEGCD
jgi:hypothetical protein